MPDIVAGVIGIALVFIWIYCLYDVVTTHDGLVRNLPKIAWFVINLELLLVTAYLLRDAVPGLARSIPPRRLHATSWAARITV